MILTLEAKNVCGFFEGGGDKKLRPKLLCKDDFGLSDCMDENEG